MLATELKIFANHPDIIDKEINTNCKQALP